MNEADEEALRTLRDAGLPDGVARELLTRARISGMTMSGAQNIEIDRVGPWEWNISDGKTIAIAHDPEDALRHVAVMLYGDSSRILGVTVHRDETPPWERARLAHEEEYRAEVKYGQK